jgi:hypothetical protein
MIEREQPGQWREVTEDELKAQNARMARQANMQADPWVNRAAGMRCKTCLWFVKKEPTNHLSHIGQHEVGRCRRHAPTMGGYPVVYMTDWCGDHRLDENKI